MNAIFRLTDLNALMFTVLVLLSFVSCERIPEPNTKITIRDGLIFKQGEQKPFSGTINDTVNGKMIEYEVANGKKNGEFKTYFKNGKLEMMGQIEKNLNQGKWTYYYQSGQVESEGTFKDDLPDGQWKWFYENGNLKEEGNYEKGNRDGKCVLYEADGKIKEEKVFKKNLIIEAK